jgi:hypothetical protein
LFRINDLRLGFSESEGFFVIIWGSRVSVLKSRLWPYFTAIEVSRCQEGSTLSSRLGNKGNKELKGLSCSINYDSKGGSASHGRVKRRVSLVLYEA